ncbi:MAG: serine hydrolase, partial [Candidatus Levybacteria bacterium]|nr:serine hydrolase [Candidatus Levybacteria bacterium]
MKKILILIGMFVVFGIAFFYYQQRNEVYNEIISPLSESMEEMGFLKKNNTSPVGSAIDTVLDSRKGSSGHAIYYKDIKTGETYEKNAQKQFQAASLYKLWIMGEVFHQIDEGKLKKEDILKDSVENLNKRFNIASESAEKKEGEVELSVEDGLEKMITISDNYAALLLSSKVRLSNVTNFLKRYGLTHSSIGVPPKTTAHDTGIFFDKIYKGEIVGQLYSKEMQSILRRQKLNDRLPKYLPEPVLVAHKTGELDGFKHDGGIIYAPKGPYILVVLS